MRIAWFVGLLASSAAFADAPKPVTPDLVITWESGEMSRDMSIWRTQITVTGTKLQYRRKYSGRMPGNQPVNVDATVKDPKKVEAALGALDKLKVTVKPASKDQSPDRYNLRSGCVRRGAVERCASVSGQEKDSDELKAIAAVRDAVLDGVKIPL